MDSLARGTEEHAAEAERKACCAAVMAEDRGSRGIATIEVSKRAAAAQRCLHTARRCHERLRALAESRGEPKTCGEDAVRKSIAKHLRNAEFPMTKAEPAEANAAKAADALSDIIGPAAMAYTPRDLNADERPVCRMTRI